MCLERKWKPIAIITENLYHNNTIPAVAFKRDTSQFISVAKLNRQRFIFSCFVEVKGLTASV